MITVVSILTVWLVSWVVTGTVWTGSPRGSFSQRYSQVETKNASPALSQGYLIFCTSGGLRMQTVPPFGMKLSIGGSHPVSAKTSNTRQPISFSSLSSHPGQSPVHPITHLFAGTDWESQDSAQDM